MTEQMKVVPKAEKVQTGVKDTKALAVALTRAVADTYRLIFKTHAYHWNVEGPLFYSIHHLTDAQYNEMFPAADDLAERIRALGQLAPFSLADVMKAVGDQGSGGFALDTGDGGGSGDRIMQRWRCGSTRCSSWLRRTAIR